MMETLLAAAAVIGVVLVWRDNERRHALLRRQLEERLHSRDERLRMIDAELRKVHAVATELLDPPIRSNMPPEDMARLEALKALYRAGDMACGQWGWPNPSAR